MATTPGCGANPRASSKGTRKTSTSPLGLARRARSPTPQRTQPGNLQVEGEGTAPPERERLPMEGKGAQKDSLQSSLWDNGGYRVPVILPRIQGSGADKPRKKFTQESAGASECQEHKRELKFPTLP
ncbi:hypothetical protein BTVI_121064 [Pitangus sulphuratus]|nr:hypothetical protein BTVI_121064 [Pitangus sulphuratus]